MKERCTFLCQSLVLSATWVGVNITSQLATLVYGVSAQCEYTGCKAAGGNGTYGCVKVIFV